MKAPIDAGVAAINADSEITDRHGTPIKAGSSFSFSNFENNNSNGGADLSYEVSGPNGSANVAGHMKLVNGDWGPNKITITFSDGTTKTLN